MADEKKIDWAAGIMKGNASVNEAYDARYGKYTHREPLIKDQGAPEIYTPFKLTK